MSYLTGDSLAVRIRIAFGAAIAADPSTWTWTDVTAWWHTPDDVRIGWGRSSGAGQAETSTLALTLKNTDGRFTAYDPRSPYWPNVRKWTPIEYDINLGDGAGWRNRFSGYIRKLPLTWPGASPFMALAPIEAVGVLGRIGRGNPPERSAMRRTIPATGAIAYWPIEDGADSSEVGSAHPGHDPLSITGPVSFAPIESWADSRGYEVRYGTAALADVSAGAVLSASVPPSVTAATATASGWTVAVAADVGNLPALSTDLVLLEVYTPGGTFVRWRMLLTKTNRTQIIGYTAGGTATWVVDDPSSFGAMVPHNMTVFQDGVGVVRAGFSWSSVGGYEGTGSVAGTVAGVTGVSVNPTAVTSTEPVPVGHLAVWPGHDLPAVDIRDGKVILALFGFSWTGIVTGASGPTGERATTRLARLAAEDGIAITVPAVASADQVMMGVQHPGTSVALYQQCETADLGLLYEHRFGLGYLPRVARYNSPATLIIDAAAGQLGMPFDPVDDDRMLRNLWTVERIDGSSAVAADQESIEFQGPVEGTVPGGVNLAKDADLPGQAAWRLRLSTVQEPSYPSVSINVAAHRELAAAWCACKPGSRIQVVNPPAQNVPGVVDQVIVGATETYRGRLSWRVTLNVEPAAPWDVAEVDGEQRVPADGSTLAVGVSSSATSMQLSSTAANGGWTTDPADFPLPVRIGGEQVTVSSITGTGLTQTATITARGVNGVQRAWAAGVEVDVWQPAIAPL
jgi:hypothetical protein